jgi:hypothetical protein
VAVQRELSRRRDERRNQLAAVRLRWSPCSWDAAGQHLSGSRLADRTTLFSGVLARH